jgi:tripartite ATP-independent transporter DctP family solute receptor
MRGPRFAFWGLVFSALLVFGISERAARAEPIEIKIHHVGAPGSLYDIAFSEYIRRAQPKLKDLAKITVYGAGKLGDDTTALEKVKTGEITIVALTSVMTSVHDYFGIFDMPFLIRNRDHMKKVRAAIFEPYLKPGAASKGYRLLALWEDGFRQMTNNVRPIDVPADLKGVRMRTPKGVWRVKMFESYGATAVPVNFPEVYAGLKSGEKIDGQETPLSFIDSSKFYEVQKYLTISNHVYFPFFIVAGEENFAKLPKKVQKVLTDTALEMQDWTLDLGEKLDLALIERLKQYMQVNEADVLAFTIQSQAIFKEYAKTTPATRNLLRVVFKLTPKTS